MRGFLDETPAAAGETQGARDVDVVCGVKRDEPRAGAILITVIDATGASATGVTKDVWVPRSLLRSRVDNRGLSTITVPEWFARKEGLI